MFEQFDSSRGCACARRLSGYFAVLAALLLTLVSTGAFAQVTHVANPYVGAKGYVSPDYPRRFRKQSPPRRPGLPSRRRCLLSEISDRRLDGPYRRDYG